MIDRPDATIPVSQELLMRKIREQAAQIAELELLRDALAEELLAMRQREIKKEEPSEPSDR